MLADVNARNPSPIDSLHGRTASPSQRLPSARSGYDRDLAYETRSHDASLPFVAERIRPLLCACFRGADDETSELLIVLSLKSRGPLAGPVCRIPQVRHRSEYGESLPLGTRMSLASSAEAIEWPSFSRIRRTFVICRAIEIGTLDGAGRYFCPSVTVALVASASWP